MSNNSDDRQEISPSTASRARAWFIRNLPEILIFFFYFLVTALLTWPLIIKFNTSIYGFPNDNVGSIWSMWWFKNASALGGTADFTLLKGFPFGTNLTGFSVAEPVIHYGERFLLLFLNEVAVYNLEIFSGFFLSGITMYYLVRYLTGDRRAAFFGGFAYVVSTYHAYNALYFERLSMTQWIPLYVLALLVFIRKPKPKYAILLGLAGILVAGTSIHYGLLMGVFTAGFLVGRYAYIRISYWLKNRNSEIRVNLPWKINRKTLALSLLALAMVIVVILPFFYMNVWNLSPPGEWETSTSPAQVRSLTQSFWGSAFPREYVYPCKLNPTFGWITDKMLGTKARAFGESLYLGWTIILLALLGVFLGGGWLSRRKRRRAGEEREPREEPVGETEPEKAESILSYNRNRAVIWGFLVGGLTCFIFSLQPYVTIGSTRIPTPSMIFRYLMPWFRWYMRMGQGVIFAAIVLACFGLVWLLGKLKGSLKEVVLVALSGILFAEMIIIPPFRNFDFEHIPEVYRQIEEMPEGTSFVFYPAFETAYFNNSLLHFYQRYFQKPLLNGAYDNSEGEALRRTVYNPYNPATPSILSRFGITHLALMKEMFDEYEWYEEDPELDRALAYRMILNPGDPANTLGLLSPLTMPVAVTANLLDNLEWYEEQSSLLSMLPPGLILERSYHDTEMFGDVNIYRIEAAPADIVPLYLGDISVPHMDAGVITVRLVGRGGTIKLLNFTEEAKEVALELPVRNLSIPHHVFLVSSETGEVLSEIELSGSEEGMLRVNSLTVPPEGRDLLLQVSGGEVGVGQNEITLFGYEKATVSIGDVNITDID